MNEKANILLVDDDEDILMELADLLMDDYNIIKTDNGLQALDILKREKIDLALLDIMMPVMDGFELVQKMHSNRINTPFIFLTAKTQIESKIKGLELGADDYICKPFNTYELKLKITKKLAQEKKIQSLEKELAFDSIEQHYLQRNLEKTEYLYRAMFENMNDAVAIYKVIDNGDDFIFKDFNKAGEKIDNISKEDLLGKTLSATFPGIKKTGLLDIMRQVWLTGESQTLPATYYEDERIQGWRENQVYKLPNGELVCIYRDLSKEKRIEHERNQSMTRLLTVMERTIQALARTIEMRDPYTAGHQKRVASLATAIARNLSLPAKQIEGIHFAALIHDIGKIHIPLEILNRPGKLTKIEFSLLQVHPEAGNQILQSIDFPWPIAEIVLQHHERLDGSGYPRGLQKDDILLEAKIISVSDVVEAMISHRPYRPALKLSVALDEISTNSHRFYDSDVVDVCLRLFQDKKFQMDA